MATTREVSVGMLFAQARQVMREYEAADSQPREQETASSGDREYEAADAGPREHEAVGADVLAPSRD
jgi:hypothetical protein